MGNFSKKTKAMLAKAIALVMAFSVYAPTMAFAATDTAGHWAEAVMADWQNKGLISGYDDGTLRPDAAITRAEFVQLINQAKGFTETAEVNFSDVTTGDWFYNAVATAMGAAYCSGFPDGTFQPNAVVTRAQAAGFVANAAGLEANAQGAANLSDYAALPSWATGAIGAVVSAGYMSGYPDGSFQADRTFTRAEAVSTLDRVINGGKTEPADPEAPSEDDVVLSDEGATLQDEEVKGNVIISEELGDGSAYIKNSTIDGDVIVRGGGSNSIHIENTSVGGQIELDNENVRVSLEGDTDTRKVVFKAPGILDKAKGFNGTIESITISPEQRSNEQYIVRVPAEKLSLESRANLMIGATIKQVDVVDTATDAKIEVASGVTVERIVADARVAFVGNGTVKTLEANESGITVEQGVKVNDTEGSEKVNRVENNSSSSSGGGGGGSSSGGGSSDNNDTSDDKTKITGMELVSAPARTSYEVDDKMDLTGFSLNLVKSNGQKTLVTKSKLAENSVVVTPAQDTTITMAMNGMDIVATHPQGGELVLGKLTVENSGGGTEPAPSPANPSVSCANITGTEGVAITPVTAKATGFGSDATIVWSATDLPAGLAIDANTGVISGTPTAETAAEGQKAIIIATAGSVKVETEITVTIAAKIAVDSVAVAPQTTTIYVGDTAALTATVLPQDASVKTVAWTSSDVNTVTVDENGVIVGKKAGGPITITAMADGVEGTATVTVKAKPAVTCENVTGTVDTAISGGTFTATATGFDAAFTWSATGMPEGLSINPNTGEITGTPKAAGTTKVTIIATSGSGQEAITAQTEIQVVISSANASITVSNVTNAKVGIDVTVTPQAAGVTNPAWSQTGLPEGLSIDAGTGEITGKPVVAGEFEVTITAAGDGGAQASAVFKITVAKAKLTVSGAVVTKEKVYDGGTTAEVTGPYILGNILDAHKNTVKVEATAAYDTKDVADGITITVTYSISGEGSENYEAPDPTSETGDITAKELQVVGIKATYNADTQKVELDYTDHQFAGLVAQETVELDTTNVQATVTGKTNKEKVTVTGLALRADGMSGNYQLQQPDYLTVDASAEPTEKAAQKALKVLDAVVSYDKLETPFTTDHSTTVAAVAAGVKGAVEAKLNGASITDVGVAVEWKNPPAEIKGAVAAADYAFTVTLTGTTDQSTASKEITVNVKITADEPEPVVKTVTVGAQQGALTAGAAGQATFTVTTANIANGATPTVNWTAGAVPNGVTAETTTVSTNAATITMKTTEQAAKGSYEFTVTADGVTSANATLVIGEADAPLAPPAFEATKATVGVGDTTASFTLTETLPSVTLAAYDASTGDTIKGAVTVDNKTVTLKNTDESKVAAGKYYVEAVNGDKKSDRVELTVWHAQAAPTAVTAAMKSQPEPANLAAVNTVVLSNIDNAMEYKVSNGEFAKFDLQGETTKEFALNDATTIQVRMAEDAAKFLEASEVKEFTIAAAPEVTLAADTQTAGKVVLKGSVADTMEYVVQTGDEGIDFVPVTGDDLSVQADLNNKIYVRTKAVGDGLPGIAQELTVAAEHVSYGISFTAASNEAEVNGVTATGAIKVGEDAAAAAAAAGTTVTVTVTLSGNATAAGTYTVGVTSTKAGTITSPATVEYTATAEQAVTPSTFEFTFTMPASLVDDLAVTHAKKEAQPQG